MRTATYMILATGMSVVRKLRELRSASELPARSRDISRTILGGALGTAFLLALDAARAGLGQGIAAVVVLTSLMLNGVPLAEASASIISNRK